MDSEKVRVVHEKMRRHVHEDRIQALQKRGSIKEYLLQDVATIRSLKMTARELHERALDTGATEEEIEAVCEGQRRRSLPGIEFDPKTALIQFIVQREKEITPSLREQAEDYTWRMRARLRESKSWSNGHIISPESLAMLDEHKKATSGKVEEEEKALPCGFQKGDVVTTMGGRDEDGPWRNCGVGVILQASIHGRGFVDVLFDRTGDVFKIKAKNLRRFSADQSDEAFLRVGRTTDASEASRELPALRSRDCGGCANGFKKGVSIYDRIK
jgi:hypothetical protein